MVMLKLRFFFLRGNIQNQRGENPVMLNLVQKYKCKLILFFALQKKYTFPSSAPVAVDTPSTWIVACVPYPT